MKKYILLFAISVFAFTSCYDDYVIDYDKQAVGFANQTDVRSVIVGEGLSFSTGVALGGVLANDSDRVVSYKIDNSLVNESTLSLFKSHPFSYISSLFKSINSITALSGNEYSLVNEGGMAGKSIIRKGSHVGRITVKIDSAAYFAGDASLSPSTVIPISITDGGGTEIMEGKGSTVIGVRYENMLFGHWWHGGKARVVSADGQEREETYFTEIPQSDNHVWTLTTVSPHSLTANAVGNELNVSSAQMKITINESDGSVEISSVEGAKYVVEPDGESKYNCSRLLQERKIYLNYKFEKDGEIWHASDTLTFRNRVRDGVNEWQDENPDNYNK